MIQTKGNVVVENIKVGDIHYEYDLGCSIKVQVIAKPIRDENGYWKWKSRIISTGTEVDYGVHELHIGHAPRLYTYEAYSVHKNI